MPAMATKKVDAREYKKDKAMFALATQKAKKVVKQVMAAKPVSLSDDSDVDDTKEDMETKSTSKAMKAMAMKKAMKATSAAKRKRFVDDDDSDIDAKVPSKRFSKVLKSIEKVRKSNEKKTPAPKNQRAKRPYERSTGTKISEKKTTKPTAGQKDMKSDHGELLDPKRKSLRIIADGSYIILYHIIIVLYRIIS